MAFVPAIVGAVQAVGTAVSAASGALSLIGTGISVVGGISQAKAAKAEANYRAEVASSNAMQEKFDSRVNEQSAKVNAESARLEGAEAMARSKAQSRRAFSKMQASQTRLGLSVDSISLKDSLKSFDSRNRSEESGIQFQTALKTRSDRFSGRSAAHAGQRGLALGRASANMFRASGKNQYRSGMIGTLGSGMSGLADWGATYGR